jgi:hypothetical protein
VREHKIAAACVITAFMTESLGLLESLVEVLNYTTAVNNLALILVRKQAWLTPVDLWLHS